MGGRHLRHSLPKGFKGLVNLPHPAPLPRVGRLPPVLAQRRGFLLGLRRPGPGGDLQGDVLQVLLEVPPAQRPGPQGVLVASGGLVGVAVVVGVGVRGAVQGDGQPLGEFLVVLEHGSESRHLRGVRGWEEGAESLRWRS